MGHLHEVSKLIRAFLWLGASACVCRTGPWLYFGFGLKTVIAESDRPSGGHNLDPSPSRRLPVISDHLWCDILPGWRSFNTQLKTTQQKLEDFLPDRPRPRFLSLAHRQIPDLSSRRLFWSCEKWKCTSIIAEARHVLIKL